MPKPMRKTPVRKRQATAPLKKTVKGPLGRKLARWEKERAGGRTREIPRISPKKQVEQLAPSSAKPAKTNYKGLLDWTPNQRDVRRADVLNRSTGRVIPKQLQKAVRHLRTRKKSRQKK